MPGGTSPVPPPEPLPEPLPAASTDGTAAGPASGPLPAASAAPASGCPSFCTDPTATTLPAERDRRRPPAAAGPDSLGDRTHRQ
ncbi:hypothetical protein BJF90_37015 [Pseudonocardia sp. CNS-004]|nr:hypothetical protein BJF90_37015 [Pseudonocardia sp. CNS-004]